MTQDRRVVCVDGVVLLMVDLIHLNNEINYGIVTNDNLFMLRLLNSVYFNTKITIDPSEYSKNHWILMIRILTSQRARTIARQSNKRNFNYQCLVAVAWIWNDKCLCVCCRVKGRERMRARAVIAWITQLNSKVECDTVFVWYPHYSNKSKQK